MALHSSPNLSAPPVTLPPHRPWLVPALILGVWLSLFLLRLWAPFNLLDKDQDLTASYVLDAVANGNWLCPVDDQGEICSKPPLHTWLAGLVALAGGGRVTETALFLPGALALLLVALLAWRWGDRRFGAPAGLFAALALVASPAGAKMVHLARTDPVFTAAVFLAALAAFRAWETGRGWAWFWLAAAAATLTKGPLGVVLGGAGLLAVVWEGRRSGPPTSDTSSDSPAANGPGASSGMVAGIALYLLLTGGWFLLAYGFRGDALLDKMMVRELWGHVATVGADRHTVPGEGLLKPIGHFLLRFLPWSLLALAGFWRVLRRPAAAAGERRLERFLFCQFWAGMLLFSLTSHQRPDLEFPLLPAAALLAGRELRLLAARVAPVRLAWAGALVWLAALSGLGGYYYRVEAATAPVRATAAVAQLARATAERLPPGTVIHYVDALFGLQYYRQELPDRLTVAEAARLLRSPRPVVLAVRRPERFAAALSAGTPAPVPLIVWPLPQGSHTTLVGNAAAAQLWRASMPPNPAAQPGAPGRSDKKKP
ncbi:MAG: glycosyltransferase family 39 protein [Lentisphaeria bacterium]